MSNIQILMRKGKDFDITLGKIEAFSKEAARKGFFEEAEKTAFNIKKEAILSMLRTPKSGRRYKKKKVVHTASSPGNPPAVFKGRLLRSIQVDKRFSKKVSGEVREIEVGSNIKRPKYPGALEFGAKIRHPGGTPYGYKTKRAAKLGQMRFLKKGTGYVVFGRTRPHKIRLKPRPFLIPALEKNIVGFPDRLQKSIARVAK